MRRRIAMGMLVWMLVWVCLAPVAQAACRWEQTASGAWELWDDAGRLTKGWAQVDGHWYCFDSRGIMQTGWIQTNGQWYFMDPSGRMLTGWIHVGQDWYLMNRQGAMVTGWYKTADGTWYYLSTAPRDEGKLLSHTYLEDKGQLYYLDDNGAMAAGILPTRADGSVALENLDAEARERAFSTAYLAGIGVLPAGIRRNLDPRKPMLALTFDDGPGVSTPAILDALSAVGARATFFVVGKNIASHKEDLARMAQLGMEVGAHGWSHSSLGSMKATDIRNELAKTCQAIYQYTGQTPRIMRPPYGSSSQTLRNVCREEGLALIHWSVDPQDWKTQNAQSTRRTVLRDAADGSIILCHDIQKSTGNAMATLIPELVQQGWQLVTVSELLAYRSGGALAGEMYKRAAP